MKLTEIIDKIIIQEMKTLKEGSKEKELIDQKNDLTRRLNNSIEHARKFGGERTNYAISQMKKELDDLNKKIDSISSSKKKIGVKDIDIDKIESSNGQYIKKEDLKSTSTLELKKMLKKVDDLESEKLKKFHDFYSDDNGGGPAYFYHIKRTIKQELDSRK